MRRAMLPAAAGVALALVLAAVLGGREAAWSAALGVAIVAANFAAHGLSLAWASTVSIAAVVGVALGGVVVRLGAIVAAIAALDRLEPFSAHAFAAAVVPATVALLAVEARLVARGIGGDLDLPPDEPVVRLSLARRPR